MNRDGENSNIFTPGSSFAAAPAGDPERQAIDSLRGYAYQVTASALAWLDLEEKGRLYLEVAEDYATIAGNVLKAVQIKDNQASGSVTLNSEGVRNAIEAFVDLVARNPERAVELRYFTTSPIGTERARTDRPNGKAGLAYWRKVASGADIGPLRSILESDNFSESVREFVRARNDDALRTDLLQKIHWHCGQPNMESIRRELEARLIVFGRDRFGLPAMEAQRLVDVLIYHVLKKCIIRNVNDRALTRADLYTVIDKATRQSVPRAAVDTMMQLASAFANSLAGGLTDTALTTSNISWLIMGNDIPIPRFIISRPKLETSIAKVIETHGLMILVGGTGLGKSLVARTIAVKHGNGFTIADLRDADKAETRHRLGSLLGRIGGITSRWLILEDLDHFEDAGISLSLGCIAEALRRRDRIGLVTSHRRPSARTLTELGLDASDVIEVPYFSEAEAAEVVRVTGGDPEIWGRLSYVAGAHGHPQLVHAFAIGMAARGWPKEAMQDVVSRGFSSEDIDAERDAARRSLTAALPVDTRTLLYRLSLAIGRFDRTLALDVGSLSPAIVGAGERLDELVGPWIEAVGTGQYRVSPLASNAGQGALTADEQRSVHNLIATRLLARRKIDASDANMILVHALVGKSTQSLAKLAHMVMMARHDSLGPLSEHFFMLRALRTDGLIYPDSPPVSRLLRLAQLKLIAETKNGSNILSCVTALLNEAKQETDSPMDSMFEKLALSSVLSIPSIADHLVTWISLLRRFRAIVETDPDMQKLKVNVEKASDGEDHNFYGTLFQIGAYGISSVARLGDVIDELDALDAEERALWLCEYDRKPDDYGILVNGPWLAEHNRKAVNATDAAERYKRMAEKTQSWGMRELAIRCHAARAVMLDEYGNDKEAGLRALDEGVTALGENVVLSRARAKVLWRHNDHSGAIKIMRGIADLVGRDNPIERAFAMREAAISAAKTNDWRQAEIWFADGRTAAAAAHAVDMQAMAIGLGTDAAVAAVNIGERDRALERLVDALVALKSLDPEASLRAAYCHRVVRHTVLWTKSQLGSHKTKLNGEPISMLPGTCSNPEPLTTIRELPLGHLDLAWYMLAQAEIDSGANIGIAKTLHAKLAQGPIPFFEAILLNQWMSRDIACLDPLSFAGHMHSWLDGMAFMHTNRKDLRTKFDATSPTRGSLPSLTQDELAEDYLQAAAVTANLSFCMVAALRGETEAIAMLEAQLVRHFGNEFPGSALFKYWQGKPTSLDQLDEVCAKAIGLIRTGQYVQPGTLWEMGLRLFEKVRQSSFTLSATPAIAKWLRAQWIGVIANQRFYLLQPGVTVPMIEAALANENDDEPFVAELLLSTADAVGASLAAAYKDQLRNVIRDTTATDPN